MRVTCSSLVVLLLLALSQPGSGSAFLRHVPHHHDHNKHDQNDRGKFDVQNVLPELFDVSPALLDAVDQDVKASVHPNHHAGDGERHRQLEDDRSFDIRTNMVVGSLDSKAKGYQMSVQHFHGQRVLVGRMDSTTFIQLADQFINLVTVATVKVHDADVCANFVPEILGYSKRVNADGETIFYVFIQHTNGDLLPPIVSERSEWFEVHSSEDFITPIRAMVQMALGLKCVHMAGLIHRDVRLQNFLHTHERSWILISGLGDAITFESRHKFTEVPSRENCDDPDVHLVDEQCDLPPESVAQSAFAYDVWQLGHSFQGFILEQRNPNPNSTPRDLIQAMRDMTENVPDQLINALAHLVTRMVAKNFMQRPSLESCIHELMELATAAAFPERWWKQTTLMDRERSKIRRNHALIPELTMMNEHPSTPKPSMVSVFVTAAFTQVAEAPNLMRIVTELEAQGDKVETRDFVRLAMVDSQTRSGVFQDAF